MPNALHPPARAKSPDLLVLVLALLASAGITGRAADAASTSPGPQGIVVTVDCAKVLNNNCRRSTGVNMDYLMDDDRNGLLSPKRTLTEGLRELSPGNLRYPGGWKSAINLWSTPPYEASRPVLAAPMPKEWLRGGLRLTNPDGSWAVDPLDFDEFMGVCREVGAEPYVVTAYEACRWPPMPGWKPPSLEQLLSTASAWVRYANKTRSYGVRYWEIGNETWLKNETWSNHISAAAYAADLVEFSRRMKAEDPSIQIGANGDSDNWWREVLQRAAPHIDFMSVHSYPCWKWTGYEDYRTNSLDILGVVRTATNALAKYAPAHQRRIRIALTEFAAGTFGDWDKTPADLGRALITFDLQGQLLACPEVAFSHFWTTHNIYTDVNGDVFETLKRDNSLSPIGRALWIWNHFLGDEMLATTSAPSIRCYASRRAGQELSLFLVNKELSSCVIDVSLKNLPGDSWRAEQWTLSGTGAGDRNPTWREAGPIRVSNSRVSPRLEPVSVMVIRVSKEPSPRKPVR